MSLQIIGVHNKDGTLKQPTDYSDGMTKQCFKNECDIQKIMARAEKAGTISHLEKFSGQYADFSDVDFHSMTTTLTRGREIFDELPAEIRREFGQSQSEFFKFVNDPANRDDLIKKLPALAQPGRQLQSAVPPTADEEAASAAASDLGSATSTPTPTTTVENPTPPPTAPETN